MGVCVPANSFFVVADLSTPLNLASVLTLQAHGLCLVSCCVVHRSQPTNMIFVIPCLTEGRLANVRSSSSTSPVVLGGGGSSHLQHASLMASASQPVLTPDLETLPNAPIPTPQNQGAPPHHEAGHDQCALEGRPQEEVTPPPCPSDATTSRVTSLPPGPVWHRSQYRCILAGHQPSRMTFLWPGHDSEPAFRAMV